MLTKSLANDAAVREDDTLTTTLQDQHTFQSANDSTPAKKATRRTPSDILKRVMDLAIAIVA